MEAHPRQDIVPVCYSQGPRRHPRRRGHPSRRRRHLASPPMKSTAERNDVRSAPDLGCRNDVLTVAYLGGDRCPVGQEIARLPGEVSVTHLASLRPGHVMGGEGRLCQRRRPGRSVHIFWRALKCSLRSADSPGSGGPHATWRRHERRAIEPSSFMLGHHEGRPSMQAGSADRQDRVCAACSTAKHRTRNAGYLRASGLMRAGV